MEPFETIEADGLKIHIYQDEYPESPRNWDNLGEMICFHGRYDLGDKHNLTADEARELAKRPDVESIPLFLLDHSGLAMRTHDFQDCDPGAWDSGCVGFIYCTHETIKKEYGKVTKATIKTARECMQGEVETYNDYIGGNVYGYAVEGEDGEQFDSCWGFYGDPDKSGLMEEAENSVECARQEIAKRIGESPCPTCNLPLNSHKHAAYSGVIA